MDRNVWDKKTPQGFTDFLKKGSVIELCIYLFEHSAKDEALARADVEKASQIWCQCGINVQAIHLERLSPFAVSEPLDLNSSNLAAQISCDNTFPDAAVSQLFGIGRPNCPGDSYSIAVYYIPGKRLKGGFATGCYHFRVQGGDGKPEHIILLTDEASGQVLAHELGHALFLRKDPPNNWINHDPDPEQKLADPSHNKNEQNLMHFNVHPSPTISNEQSKQAKKSELVSTKDLAFGFRENKPFKLGVTMNTLHIAWTDDEYFSDDALESKWFFRVKTGITDSIKEFTESALGAGDRTLPSYLYYPNLELASDTDELIIEVTGTDTDFGPNDKLPTLKKIWKKGSDFWGSGSTIIPFGILGEHKDGPVKNDEIEYSLTYQIILESKPIEEIFRIIC